MCGRFTLTDPTATIRRFRPANAGELALFPRFNIAPSQDVLVILHDGGKRIGDLFRWGLVPFWSPDAKQGFKRINARAETLSEKPSFRHLLRHRRCLVPADGFIEWKKTEGKKQPYHIRLKNGEPFAFAGLWDCWDKGGTPLYTCTIITTEPNSFMRAYHHRMPVILPREAEEEWLDPDADPTRLKHLLVPFPEESLTATAISTKVNSPAHDTPDVLAPISPL
jgi:putative SOS response-associated peptidase YedK